MGLFSGFMEGGEAITLQKEFDKLEPDLERLYKSEYFKPFYNAYIELQKEYGGIVDNMTKKGQKEYLLGHLQKGQELINHNMAVGSAFILFSVYYRSSMIDDDVARDTVKRIKNEFYIMNLLQDAIEANCGW